MFASVRKYKLVEGQQAEFNRRVNEGFLAVISSTPGFVSYTGIDAGDGAWASVSVFETEDGALESNRAAAAFVAEHLAPLIAGAPEIISGRLAASKRRQGP